MMDLMHLVSYMTLLFYLFFILIAETTARPPTDLDTFIPAPLNIDPNFSAEYLFKYPARSAIAKDSLLSRLRRGYYYIDERDITPVNPFDLSPNIQIARRRLGSDVNQKNVNNKPKKLFVPNLFG